MDTKVESITIEQLSVTMTLDEWRRVLGDDAPFKAELRKLLAGREAAKHNGAPKRRGRQPGKVRAGELSPAMAKCQHCGKIVKARGLGVHEARCPALHAAIAGDAKSS